MADEIVEKYARLNIEEEENELIDVGEFTSAAADEKISLMLVGKLLTDRTINVEAFKRTMTNAWALSRKLVIRAISPNRFVFQFFHWKDKDKVLMGRPWCFDQHLLVSNEISGNEQPDDVPLTQSPFWICIYNLPFNCSNGDVITTIASKIRVVVEIEEDELCLEKYRRVKVMLDVTKPLRRFQRIRNMEGKVVKVHFKYERLPFFCFLCGVMGHSEKDCPDSEDEENDGNYGWGIWLKASPRNGRSRDIEEVEAVKAGRKVLFVGKWQEDVSSDSCSSNSKELIEVKMGSANGVVKEKVVSSSRKQEEAIDTNLMMKSHGGTKHNEVGATSLHGKSNDGVPFSESYHVANCQAQAEMPTFNMGLATGHNNGNSSGMGFWWRDINVALDSYSNHHFDVNVQNGDSVTVWKAMGIYGWLDSNEKLRKWHLMRSLWSRSTAPVVMFGDFNEITSMTEKDGGVMRGERQMDWFRGAIDDCQLRDLGYGSSIFTWQRGTTQATYVRERLDRFLENDGWCDLFPSLTVVHLPIYRSDHAPILLKAESHEGRRGRERLFHFESLWLSSEDCVQVVRGAWNEGENAPITSKLCMVGDGRNIRVWDDAWLSVNSSSIVPTPNVNCNPNMLVEELIDAERGVWDADLIRSIFNEEESKIILDLPLASPLPNDQRYWWPTKNGIFTVKSYYWLGRRGHLQTWQSHPGMIDDEIWKIIWGLDEPPKLSHFLLRVCNGSLAVMEKLNHCQLCPTLDAKYVGIRGFLGMLLDMPTSSMGARFRWVADKMLCKEGVPNSGTGGTGVERSLDPPMHDCIKINFDAHTRAGHYVGLGAIFHDSGGRVLATASRRLRVGWSPEMAEVAAAVFGLRMALNLGYSKVELEGDAASVVT
ncbi:hypothetical protein RDABS01_018463, partial [Bienertia sinuspersici]